MSLSRRLSILCASLALLAWTTPSNAVVRYVDANIAVSGNGLSWATAYKLLPAAIAAANSNPAITELWVADGTYIPTLMIEPPDARTVSFKLKNGLTLYGGFAGGETSLAQRNPAVNIAILSGDIGTIGLATDNAYHVIYAVNNNSTAVIDGFKISDGYGSSGAGIYINGTGSPTIRQCTFAGCYADTAAAMAVWGATPATIDKCIIMANTGSSPVVDVTANGTVVTNCTFLQNGLFGALRISGLASATIDNCVFDGNPSQEGIGTATVTLNESSSVTNCLFKNNGNTALSVRENSTVSDCTFDGNAGGLEIGNMTSPITVSNCVFINSTKTAFIGGATEVRDCLFQNNHAVTFGGAASVCCTNFVNCDFNGNTAKYGGAVNASSDVNFFNCRFAGNSVTENGGAIRVTAGDSHKVFVGGCVFTANTTLKRGGAIDGGNTQLLTVENSTFVGNSAMTGGGIATDGYPLLVENSIFWNNTATNGNVEAQQIWKEQGTTLTISSTILQGWTGTFGGTANNGTDPLLTHITGADAVIGTLDDDPTPALGSPAIDTGDIALLSNDFADIDNDSNTAEPMPLDLFGNARVFGSTLDRGAAERDPNGGEGLYIGPANGSWFVASNWSGGDVPDLATEVIINTSVVIDQVGAVAGTVTIGPRGVLALNGSRNGPSASLTCGSIDNAGSLDLVSGALIIGESLTSTTDVEVGCAGSVVITLDSAEIVAPTLILCGGGELRGDGVVSADVENGGLIDPSGATRRITIDGAYTQSSGGVLHLDLDSAAYATTFDLLEVVGSSAALSGTLDIALENAIAEPAHHTPYVGPSSTTGSFSTINLPADIGEFGFTDDFAGGDLTIISSSTIPLTNRVYVRAGASPYGGGSSWGNAVSSLDAALSTAEANASIEEIWVGEGTYKPLVDGTPGGPPSGAQSESFRLISGVATYGGFAGTETSTSKRDIAAHPTVLDGDLFGNDTPSDTTKLENAYTVVTADGVGSGTILDGFTIRNAWGDGSGFIEGEGGGIRVKNATLDLTNVTIRACAAVEGGAASITNSQVTFDHCVVDANLDMGQSTGILLNSGSLTLTDTQFSANEAGSGAVAAIRQLGGVLIATSTDFVGNERSTVSFEGGSATLTDCTFDGNGTFDPGTSGGALSIDGQGKAFASIAGCAFSNNIASAGGAIACLNGAAITISDCTFTGNIASLEGGAIWSSECEPTIDGCDFNDNQATRGGALLSFANHVGSVFGVHFTDCTFDGNQAVAGPVSSVGGAVAAIAGIDGTPSPVFHSCSFTNNSAPVGGGVYLQRAVGVFGDSTFSDNVASVGSGIALETGGAITGDCSMSDDDELSATHDVAPSTSVRDTPIGTIITNRFTMRDRGEGYEDAPRLQLQLGGLFPGTSHDFVDVSNGTATLRGTLDVTLVDGHVPQAGNEYVVLEAAKRIGQFDVAVFPAIPDGLALTILNTDNEVILLLDRLGAEIAFEDPTTDLIDGTPIDAVLGDFDNDGDLDVVTLVSASGSQAVLTFSRNQGSSGGSWLGFAATTTIATIGTLPNDLAMGDVNGDGIPDVLALVGNGFGMFAFVATGSGSPVFGTPSFLVLPAGAAGITVARAGGSAPADAWITQPSSGLVQRLVNNGSGVFTLGSSTSSIPGVTRAAAADLDGDGDDELLLGTTSGQLVIHRNLGGGSVDEPVTKFAGAGLIEPLAGDLDNDGAIDVIVAGSSGIGVLRNLDNGQGTLSSAAIVPAGTGIVSPAVLDAADDGDLDLALVDAAGAAKIVRNDLANGAIALTQVNAVPNSGIAKRVLGGDVNGDGADDLLVVGITSGFAGPSGELRALAAVAAVVITGDLNGDGHVDANDLAILLGAWSGSGVGDLNGDGIVTAADLAILLGAWTG